MIRRAIVVLPLVLGLWAPPADAQTRLRYGEPAETTSLSRSMIVAPSLTDSDFSITPSQTSAGGSWQDKVMLRSLGGIEAEIVRGSNYAAGVSARSERPGFWSNTGRDDPTMEVGAFGELFLDEWSLIARVGQDVSEDGGGFVADLGIRWASQIGDDFRVEVGSGVSWASAGYIERFYGGGSRDSGGPGLRLYDATQGLKDITISGSVSYSLTESWTIGGLVGAQRLLGAAASSQLTRDDNEFFGGLSLDYKF